MDIDKMIKEAILEKNGAKKEAYRAIKAELLLIATSKNAPSIIDEATEIKVIRKLISQREESIAMYDENLLNSYPLTFEDDGMAYGVKPMLITEADNVVYEDDKSKLKVFNLFRDGYRQND